MLDSMLWFFRRGKLDATLRDELHFLKEAFVASDYFAEGLFIAVVTIDIGVIEGGDTEVQGGVDELFNGC